MPHDPTSRANPVYLPDAEPITFYDVLAERHELSGFVDTFMSGKIDHDMILREKVRLSTLRYSDRNSREVKLELARDLYGILNEFLSKAKHDDNRFII